MSASSQNSTYETVLEVCINSLMLQVRNYNEDQLKNLLNNEEQLNQMVDSLPQVSSLLKDKDLKLTQCKTLADYNLSLQPKLNDARSKLEVTHKEATELKNDVEELKKKLDTITENCSLDTTSAILQAAAQEAEDQSEALAEKFQNNEITIDEFINEYIEKRILTHIRKIKSEKLIEILRQQKYNLSDNNSYIPLVSSSQPSRASQLPGYSNSGMGRHAAYPSIHSQSHSRLF